MAGALPQRELVSIKIGGAAAMRDGQYKKQEALPQGDPGSKKFMALPVSIKSGGAAAARIGQYKKRGHCRNKKWAVSKAAALPQREMVSIKSGGAAATRNGQYKKQGRSRKERSEERRVGKECRSRWSPYH